MARLVAGNERYVSGFSAHPNNDLVRRGKVAAGQAPFATILTCADSRVPPELLFDQGLGDLFVCRVAGNVVDDALLASLEYSVIHLGSTLIMVLGHERCGAIKATIDALAGKGDPDDAGTKIGALAALIAPAVRAAPADAPDKLDAVVSINASHAAAEIFVNSPPLRARDGAPWTQWLVMGGRGAGKTRTGAEWVRGLALGLPAFAMKPVGRIALIGETMADVRDVMVEGVSGLGRERTGPEAAHRRPQTAPPLVFS
jgi:carbonic anhydrase